MQSVASGVASRASISAINNKLDFVQVTKDLASKDSLGSLGLGALTASVTAGLGDKLGVGGLTPGMNLGERVSTLGQRALLNGGVRVWSSGLSGNLDKESLGSIIKDEVSSSVLAMGQSMIGDVGEKHGFAEGSLVKVALHATAGATYSGMNGASVLSGAIGGGGSELIAGIMCRSQDLIIQTY